MRRHPQKSVDRKVQQYVRDHRDYDRQQESVTLISLGTRHYPPKRSVERVRHRDDKLHEARSAARRHQSQQKPHPQQRVNHIEDVIDYL